MNTSLLAQKTFKKVKAYFENKVVWITGASRGIGEQLSLQLNQLHAKLILSARSEQGLQRVRQQMTGDKYDVHILPLDLNSPESLNEKIQQTG